MSHTKKPTIEKIILALLGLLALAALVRTMFLGLEIDESTPCPSASALCAVTGSFTRCGSRTSWPPCRPLCSSACLPPSRARPPACCCLCAALCWLSSSRWPSGFTAACAWPSGGAAPICWRWPCWPSRPSGFWGRTTSASSSTLRWRRSCFCTATTRPARGSTAVCGGSRRAASVPV